MGEELQNLLEKLNNEGVKQGEAKRDEIISAAKATAEKIIADAKIQADNIIADAQKESAAFDKKVRGAARQAARDIVLQLKSNLQKRLEKVVAGAVNQTMSPEFMAELIKELALKFAANPNGQLNILCAIKDVEPLKSALRSALCSTIYSDPKVIGVSGIEGGLEVDFSGEKLYFDFTAEAITELLSDFGGAQLNGIFQETD